VVLAKSPKATSQVLYTDLVSAEKVKGCKRMIDLHTHSLLSDGLLLPCELVRRAEAKGYKAIAITDHADFSNIDFIVPRIAKACRILNRYWDILSIPGVEITHIPPQEAAGLVKYARRRGAKIVVGHGETVSEPVLKGTNRAFILAGADILAHPGMITVEDVKLANAKNVFLEITTRKSHLKPNRRLVKLALKYNASMVLNTDTHSPDDFLDKRNREAFLVHLGLDRGARAKIAANSEKLVLRK